MPEGESHLANSNQDLVPYIVTDVLNFGGFFGGETVTLDAAPVTAPEKITGFIIPEHVFDNLTARHLITAGMVLGLEVDNGEVRAAHVLGAPTREKLKEIVKPPLATDSGPGPRALSYKCSHDNLWITGTPELREDGGYYCYLCGKKLG